MLTTEEKKKAVIDLYFNQQKTYRQIAQELRMSLRDILAIAKQEQKGCLMGAATADNNINADKTNQKQRLEQLRKTRLVTKSTNCTKQILAYKLFSNRRGTVEVAIKLNISETEVMQYYREYCKLNKLDRLIQIYRETKGDISPLLDLYNLIKINGVYMESKVNAVKEFEELEFTGRKIERARKYFGGLDDRIRNTLRLIHNYDCMYKNIQASIRRLRKEKRQLESFVNKFEDNDENYLKIKEIVKERLDDIVMKNSEERKYILTKSGYVEQSDPATEDFLINRIINNNDDNINNNDSSSIVKDNNNNASIISDSDDPYKSALQRARNSYKRLLKCATHEIIDLAMPTPKTAAPEQIEGEPRVNKQESANFNGLVLSPKIPPYDGTDDLTIQYEMVLANKLKTLR